MMYGRGKSDSAIIAKKPTNKAGQPAAESVERRAGAEGNAVQQSTRRAQDRESVSQALDRIRRVARQRKKEKFTALLHHISPEHLEAAFFELKEDAAPGVDGLTWRAYEADLDCNIADLSAMASSLGGTSRPSALAILRLMTRLELSRLHDWQVGRRRRFIRSLHRRRRARLLVC